MFDFLKKKNKNVDSQGNSETQQADSHAAAPGTKIRFNPNLIDKLEDDEDVQSIFTNIA